jgi:hypothetical protein
LYEDLVVKGQNRSGHVFSLVVGIEREGLVLVLSSRWQRVAPGRAAVRAGRRPPPKAARSGLDGGEPGARLLDREVLARVVISMT